MNARVEFAPVVEATPAVEAAGRVLRVVNTPSRDYNAHETKTLDSACILHLMRQEFERYQAEFKLVGYSPLRAGITIGKLQAFAIAAGSLEAGSYESACANCIYAGITR